ncbi:MAG: hypothetical protein BroJett031_30150 [Betaproteobacteria bacterium]|nr:MAG: hypothetical protein BroJett031_30150 [Betaproteobacteria bacterium]
MQMTTTPTPAVGAPPLPDGYLISETAEQSGYGTDRHKHVRKLTDAERAHARAGGTVFFRAARLPHPSSPSGTYWRVVYVAGGRYYPRVPNQYVPALRALTGRR